MPARLFSATLLGIDAIAVAIYYQDRQGILAVYPFMLATLMVLKKVQVARYARPAR